MAQWQNKVVRNKVVLNKRSALHLGKALLLSLGLLTQAAQAAPTAALTSPANNAVIAAPGSVNLSARVTASSGTTISNVEFYQGSTLIGSDNSAPYSITWTNAPAGSYSLTVKATDNKGAATTSAVRTLIVDTPPTVSLTTPGAGQIITAPAKVLLSATAADSDGSIARVAFYRDGTLIGRTSSAPYTVTWNNAPAGSYSLTAIATDDKGISTTSPAVPATILTPPTVSLDTPAPPAGQAAYTAPASIPLSATASDANASITQVDFYRGNTLIGSASAAPYTVTWNNAPAGTHNLTAKVSNSNGAVATSAVLRIVVNAAPTISLTTPKANQVFLAGSSIPLAVTAADRDGTVAKIDFYQGSTLLGTVTPSTPTGTASPYTLNWDNAPAGSYSLTAIATDNQGGTTTSRPIAIVVDTPPSVSLTAPTANQQFTAPGRITLSADATDSDGTVARVQFYQGNTLIGTATKAPYSISWNNTQVGDFVLTARAIDNKGIATTSLAVPVTFVPNVAPTVTLTSPVANALYAAPATIVLSADAADSDGTIAKVAFYQGTTLIGSDSKAPYTVNWTKVAAGSYSLTAVATDNLGGITTSAPVSIAVNMPPTVSLTSPVANQRYATSPATVSLSANAADSDGTVDHVDFYQGINLIGTANSAPYTATWTNAAAGTYRITARATDNQGAITTTPAITIVIAANAPPKISLDSPIANAVYTAPATIVMTAAATDSNGSIAKVDFYQGSTLVATASTAPFTVTLSEVPAGSYSLSAVATDNSGATTTSLAMPVLVNAPPTIDLISPKANQSFSAPASIDLTAQAADSDDTIAKVDFYQGTTLLGTATAAPYSYTWANVPIGNYSVTASATDNHGAVTTSPALSISVGNNQAPTVAITSPTASQGFNAPASIALSATAADSDGTVAKVDYYQGSTLIGSSTTAPFGATWAGVAAGSYSLTAKATDNSGTITTSPAVTITVNAAPTITLNAPTPASGSTLIAPSTINLSATAADSDGTIAKVDFYQGTTLLGAATSAPYTLTWNNVSAGSYSLTAQATDNSGAVTTSAPRTLTITANSLPSVALTSPSAGQSFKAPASITITANAADGDGTISKVDFYQGSTLLGSASSTPFSYSWSNVAAGTYSLTAQATDNLGGTTTSTPVTLTIQTGDLQLYFIEADHLNTPRLITDANKVPVWKWDNTDPFGANAPDQDPNGTGNTFEFNLRFPGQYYDNETGLFYNGYRTYNPGTGRYLESDPIGLAGGLNTYAYVGGNPLSGTDPLGLQTCVLVTMSDWGFGTHAALYTSNGADNGGPALYDPSGSYHLGSKNSDAINADIVDGTDADISKFMAFHKKKDKEKTVTSCKNTTPKQEQELIEKARKLKEAYGLTCAVNVSNVINGSPAFPNVSPNTRFPGNLYRNSQ